jgi:sugar phosphate isomerase/epimerase
MILPRLALAVIGDEIGPSLPEMISFCAEHGIRRLDMRTVGGRNLLGMSLGEVAAISDTLTAAGIKVPTFVSPMLKWPAEDQPTADGRVVDFAFDPTTCPIEDVAAHAFDIATVLGATRLRAFSYLRYPDFDPDDLGPALDRFFQLAGLHDVTIELENEPVCNVGSMAELAHFFSSQPESIVETREELIQLRPLVDIANSYSMGLPPRDSEIATLAPLVDAIHLKDRDLAAERTVPLGDGDIPWAEELKRLLGGVKAKEVLVSIETHCPQDRRNATARSVAAIRRIAAEIGAEIV